MNVCFCHILYIAHRTHYKRWTVDNDQQLFLKDMKDFVNGM